MKSKNPCNGCRLSHIDYYKHHAPSSSPYCIRCIYRKGYEEYKLSNRKFTPGEPITDLQTLLSQTWVIWHGHTKHIEMFRSMSIRTVEQFLKNGAFRKAIKKEDK